jgi:two-component system cell cycle sensor histidine kinase/response regulator CckA
MKTTAKIIKRVINEDQKTNDKPYETEQFCRTVFEQSPDGILAIDMNGSFIEFNEAAHRELGYSREEFEKLRLCDIDPVQSPEKIQARIKEVLDKGRAEFDVKQRTKKGAIRDVHVITRVINLSGRTFFHTIWRDVTECRRAEEEVRVLASIIENLPDAVCAIDTRGVMMAWNCGAERMLGYKAEEIIGKPMTAILAEETGRQEIEHCMAILNAKGVFSGYESERLAKDGRRIPVELTAVAIRDKTQKIKSYASIMVDITDRKKREEERLKSHMLESIGILAGGIAHDFNNLLNIINGDIQVAKMFVQPGDKVFNRLVDAEQVCEIAGNLSKRLITFATGGDPVKKNMALSGLITETVNALLKGSNVDATLVLPDDLYMVAIDEGQMKQAIMNLVVNAMEAMPNGGTLTIRGENVRTSARDRLPIQAGNYLKMSFRDTGPGIPSEYLAKIFDPYFTTKSTYNKKGLGLGLAVCYSVIKRHDGLITVESELGKGTNFIIYLPVRPLAD